MTRKSSAVKWRMQIQCEYNNRGDQGHPSSNSHQTFQFGWVSQQREHIIEIPAAWQSTIYTARDK